MRDFNYTVNVLVKAYLNDTLEHGNCQACAVGNLIRESYGTCDASFFLGTGWPRVFVTLDSEQMIKPRNYKGLAKAQIDSTGYSWMELAQIEHAFETVCGENEDERMFNGLMTVVDVLAEIHGIELTAREEAKLLFVKS